MSFKAFRLTQLFRFLSFSFRHSSLLCLFRAGSVSPGRTTRDTQASAALCIIADQPDARQLTDVTRQLTSNPTHTLLNSFQLTIDEHCGSRTQRFKHNNSENPPLDAIRSQLHPLFLPQDTILFRSTLMLSLYLYIFTGGLFQEVYVPVSCSHPLRLPILGTSPAHHVTSVTMNIQLLTYF
jgi:hypothetical protein